MKCKLKDDAIIEFLKSNIEIEWDDIIDYLDENHLYSSDKEAILKAINYDEEESIDFDDVMNYIEHNRLSSSEEEQIKDYFADETFKINTLEDELKVDVLRNLYNNMTLQELEKIEKNITIKVI